MTSAEKLVVARQLACLGVDIIDAGFPASSPDDLDAVRCRPRAGGGNCQGDGGVRPQPGMPWCIPLDLSVFEAARPGCQFSAKS
ncbi:2-isopropylmalate synthase 2, chloroplastic-like isoform X2 [Miscanthus floridulus]|uniref:2-isopropylmalate synthase 2, chloroplastic-like isoform X2 n=1 Tax=Miscanthus floridulus TaxID=154761 RepID=UPI0034584E16